ncbi:MAG TPA: DMT family transporter [Jatrophihabitantaceae bacterium]|jgi:drug/metabolite transporter (DMT)-like permease|nr:DMT family transporter [Jatrophihabitantaceae bacterium]
MTRRSWALFAAMCVIWGIPYLLIRVAVRDVEPGTLVFARTAIGGLILLPFAVVRGGFRPVLARWRALVAFTGIELAVPWLFLGNAEKHLSSSLTGLLVAAVPLIGVLVARLLGTDDRVDLARGAGLLLGLTGVATLVGLDVGQLSAGPLLELLAVVVGYAVAPVIMSRRLADLPSIPVVSASLLLCAAGYLPYAATHVPAHVHATGVASIVVLGVVCTAIAFIVFFALIADIGPARAVVITYVNPAVAVLLGVALLGEHFTLGMGIGFPLILVGSVLAARRSPVRERALTEPLATAMCESNDAEATEADADGAPETGQSRRTTPDAVSNVAASKPVSSSMGGDQSTSMPSSG